MSPRTFGFPAPLVRRLRRWWSAIEVALARRFGLSSAGDRRFFAAIAAVGVISGLFGILVEHTLRLIGRLFWGVPGTVLEAAQAAPAWRVVAAPALGGLLVGAIILWTRRPVSGQGTALLIESIVLRQGAVPPRPVLRSALASVFTVASGGSLGKEGPLLRLDALAGSWLGQRLGLDPQRVRILVACGAAAGMAATYNAPIGGALWAMEVILGNFALEIFGPIVVASVIATAISRAALGNVPLYAAPGYELRNGWELVPYFGLGVVGAFAAVVFVFGLRWSRSTFARLGPLPPWARPALGFALVGAIGLALPQVLGNGFDGITLALHGSLPLGLLLVLPFAKIVASGLTSGSGGSGGTFTPSLFVGATVGGVYGTWIHDIWPFASSTHGAYAAVGMAAIAAGTTHAPISAILIVFELTGNYQLILPLMVAAITASLLSRRLHPYSVEEEALRQRGVDLSFRMEEAALAGVQVRSLMRADEETLPHDAPWPEIVDAFLDSRRQRLFVVDAAGRLDGGIWLHDVKPLLHATSEMLPAVVAHDLARPVDGVLRPEMRLHRAVEIFAESPFERLPVVEPGTGRLLGHLAKQDLLAVYSQEVLGRPATLATFVSGEAARDYVELPPDHALGMLTVPPALAGATLAEAKLPQRFGLRVIEVKRRRAAAPPERLLPTAATELRLRDELIVIGPREALEALEGDAAWAEAGEGRGGDDQARQ